jgi:hypothetical protein
MALETVLNYFLLYIYPFAKICYSAENYIYLIMLFLTTVKTDTGSTKKRIPKFFFF